MKRAATGPAFPPPKSLGDLCERRRYHHARQSFDFAYAMVEPFLQPEAGWQGRSLYHLSYSVICENFPELAHDEIRALLGGVHRVFIERNAAPGPAPG